MKKRPLVGAEVRVLSNLCRRELDNAIAAKNLEKLTGVQGRVIGYLYGNKEKDIFQRDVEKEFKIRRSTATAMLQNMEKYGYIVREPLKKDARMKKLVLTEKAVERFKTVETEIDNIEDKILNGISKEEREIFFRTIEKIKANLVGGKL